MAHASIEETSHIVRYYHAWLEDEHLYIQMEKMEKALDCLIGTAVEEDTLRQILHHCLLGLQHIHSHNVVHLDIKVRAVLPVNHVLVALVHRPFTVCPRLCGVCCAPNSLLTSL